MGGASRKLKRNQEKKAKKDLQKKLGMFEKLGDECLVCSAPFDKKSKQQVKEWFVVVRKEQGVVNLYCPPCWEKGQKMIADIAKDISEGKNGV
jgi:hypothetical protein